MLGEGHHIRAVVLTEGVSDQRALETLARRRGHDLAGEGVRIMAMGGATNFGHYLRALGPQGRDLAIAGLCDAAEEDALRRGLTQAGLAADPSRGDLEHLGFFVCVADLEEELIRSLGSAGVEAVIAVQGELPSFRTFQKQPAQRDRGIEAQLRRFLGTHSGRKIHYGRMLVEALNPARVPRPLDGVLDHVLAGGDPGA